MDTEVVQNEVDFTRHSGWVSPQELNNTLLIIGCGATGSRIALAAARMGFHNFILYDKDVVEAHNLPNQVYFPQHVGMNKVDALEQILKEFNPRIEVETHCEWFSKDTEVSVPATWILTVDSMSARKDIFHAFYGNPLVDYVIHTAIGIFNGEIDILDPMDFEATKKWHELLKNDDEIPDGPCNLQICSTFVDLVANYAVHQACYISKNRNVDPNSKLTQAGKTLLSIDETYMFHQHIK